MSEARVVPLPGRADARRPRDPRIDLFRGLALVMILIDHMPGNPWETVTIRTIGFSDAAEAFFVMSGVAAGIAYSPAVGRWLSGEARLWDAVAPMWSRAWTLYLVQMLLTLLALALFAWAADTFYEPKFREIHNLALIHDDTAGALAAIPVLGYQIGYVNILPTYILLMLAAPAVLAAGMRWRWPVLGAAAVLWFVAGWLGWNIPNHPGGGSWFLAPLSWQLIFVLGLLIGIEHRRGGRLVPARRWPFRLALGFLVLAFLWRHVPDLGGALNHGMAWLGAHGAPHHIVSHDKVVLALPRLLHILALTYVLSCLPWLTRVAAHRLAAPLRLLGRQGLLVFALGTVLALAGQILMRVEPEAHWLPWVLPPVAALISWLVAFARDRSVAARVPAPRRPAPMAYPVRARDLA